MKLRATANQRARLQQSSSANSSKRTQASLNLRQNCWGSTAAACGWSGSWRRWNRRQTALSISVQGVFTLTNREAGRPPCRSEACESSLARRKVKRFRSSPARLKSREFLKSATGPKMTGRSRRSASYSTLLGKAAPIRRPRPVRERKTKPPSNNKGENDAAPGSPGNQSVANVTFYHHLWGNRCRRNGLCAAHGSQRLAAQWNAISHGTEIRSASRRQRRRPVYRHHCGRRRPAAVYFRRAEFNGHRRHHGRRFRRIQPPWLLDYRHRDAHNHGDLHRLDRNSDRDI